MKRKYILLGCSAWFLSGIFLFTQVPTWVLFIIAGSFFLSSFLVKQIPVWVSCIWILFFSLGSWHTSNAPLFPSENNVGIHATKEGIPIEIKGYISAFPDKRYRKENWIITAEKVRFSGEKWQVTEGKILLTLPKNINLAFGERIQVRGEIKTPFESEEFSYKSYLARQGIFSVMSYPKIDSVHPHQSLSSENNRSTVFHPILSPLYTLRVWFENTLTKFIPPPESAFSMGILVGDRGGFSHIHLEEFQKIGLSHLLALSGYNITIIAISIFFVTFWLPKNIRIILTIGFLAAFVLFVGGGESVLRAAIMGGIGLVAVHSGRKSNGLFLLLCASSIMVAFRPLIAAYGPSFQLSFFGVLGILIFSGPLNTFFMQYIKSRFWREIIVATLSAQIGVLPLIALLFGEVSLISPLANLIIAPLVPLSMLLSFLATILGALWEPLGYILGFLTWNILHVQMFLIHLMANIPGASIPFSVGPLGFIVLLSWLGAFTLFLHTKMRNTSPIASSAHACTKSGN